jgi:hypothetical protein
MEASNSLGYDLDRTLALMSEQQGSVRNAFSNVTFEYSNPAQAGWGFGFDAATTVAGGMTLGRTVLSSARGTIPFAKEIPTIAAGTPSEIAWGYGQVSKRQHAILSQLPETLSQTTLRKGDIGVTDIAALTAQTGDEFALFTRGSQRLVIRGNANGVPLLPEEIVALREQGFRWSAHSHPGTRDVVLDASGYYRGKSGDRYVLELMQQQRSMIINSAGNRSVFDEFDNFRVK